MKEKIKKIIDFDFKYDHKREKEELKAVLIIIILLAVIVLLASSGFNYKTLSMLLGGAIFFWLYKWHRSKLKKNNL